MRPLPVLFVASFNGRVVGVSTFELASRDCVSALTRICGSASAIAVRLRLSLNRGKNNLSAAVIGLPPRYTLSTRRERGAVPIESVMKQCVRVLDVTARS